MSSSTSKATSTDERQTSSSDTSVSRPDGQLSRDGQFRWSVGWQQWVPVGKEINPPPQQIDLEDVLESGQLPTERHFASRVSAKKFDDPLDAAIREQHRLRQHIDTDQLILFVRGKIEFADAVLEGWGRGPSIKDVKEREAYELHHWNKRCYLEILRRLESDGETL